MLALESVKGQGRASVWHVHAVKMADENMDDSWLVVLRPSRLSRSSIGLKSTNDNGNGSRSENVSRRFKSGTVIQVSRMK